MVLETSENLEKTMRRVSLTKIFGWLLVKYLPNTSVSRFFWQSDSLVSYKRFLIKSHG